MKTAIVDTQTTGHHLEYIYGLCSVVGKKKKEIDIYCNSYLSEYIKENNLSKISSSYLNLKLDILEKPIGNWIQVTKTALLNIRKLRNYDRLIFLNLNNYLPALSLFAFFFKPTFSFSGIFFDPHARKTNDKKNWIRDFILRYLLRKYQDCKIFILNDREAVDILNDKYSTDAFETLVDPIPEFYYANIISKKKSEPITFTIIGSISRRKGIFEFLKAIEISESEFQFLIVGKVQNEIAEMVEMRVVELQDKGLNIQLRNEFLTNKEFAQTIINSDVIVMPYLSKGASSGILGHAAYNEKPVIGPNYGLLGDLIAKYGLGISINPKNIVFFAECLSNEQNVLKFYNKKKSKIFSEQNSLKEFYNKLLAF